MSELVKITPSQVDGLLAGIQSASSLVDLTEARARIEAARAWAKVHGQVKEMRLDLLRVEVEALVRIVELGGLETLPAKDRKAARYLAGLTAEERAQVVAQSGGVTTAAGMVRAIWTEDDLKSERERNRFMGRALAEQPDIADDESLRQYVRESTYRVEDVLANVLDEYTTVGEEFTVGEMAEEVIRRAAVGDAARDPDVERGMQEVCREAIRRAPIVKIEGTALPRIVTAKSESGHHIRIPVENASLAHLAQMIEGRRQQISHDRARLEELEAIEARLRAIPGASDDARIGDLLIADIGGTERAS